MVCCSHWVVADVLPTGHGHGMESSLSALASLLHPTRATSNRSVVSSLTVKQ